MNRTYRTSLWWLVAANLIPLAGVVWLGWDVFTLLLLYWLESAVVGLYNVLRMLKISAAAGVYFVPFFVVHYGLFMLVHLIFIVALFGRGNELREILSGIGIGIVALLISHGVSYQKNFIGGQEYKERTVKQQLFAPYGRIIVMHLTVLVGGFFVLGLGEPVGALVIMVALKIVVDAWAHVREHRVLQERFIG